MDNSKYENIHKYVQDEYGAYVDLKKKNKNRQYYEDHIKALDLKNEEDEKDKHDLKAKMLHLADMMQYEDDYDDGGLTFAPNKNLNKRQRDDSSSSEDEKKP